MRLQKWNDLKIRDWSEKLVFKNSSIFKITISLFSKCTVTHGISGSWPAGCWVPLPPGADTARVSWSACIMYTLPDAISTLTSRTSWYRRICQIQGTHHFKLHVRLITIPSQLQYHSNLYLSKISEKSVNCNRLCSDEKFWNNYVCDYPLPPTLRNI